MQATILILIQKYIRIFYIVKENFALPNTAYVLEVSFDKCFINSTAYIFDICLVLMSTVNRNV